MEECYFSIMLDGKYYQLTKANVFQILSQKDGWRVEFQDKLSDKHSKLIRDFVEAAPYMEHKTMIFGFLVLFIKDATAKN